MQNYQVMPGRAVTITRELLASALRLFGKRGEERESAFDQRVEELWEAQYRQVDRINFSEIFSTRLSNYTVSGAKISCDNEDINAPLQKTVEKAFKWCPMMFGVGRVYLVPNIINDKIFTDIIPQSKVITIEIEGDDVNGFVALADIKQVGRYKYARITKYHFDHESSAFEIENKAIRVDNGAEVPLSNVREWAIVVPYQRFDGVEKPIFGVFDSPRDNRDADKMQGAAILYGCEDTVREIYECIRQYQLEYQHKVSILGVDADMISKDKNAGTYLPREYIKSSSAGFGEGDLFSVYSPDIRSAAYQDRLLNLFARLEKQVGTSSGILTPADTSMATATQVKRSMYDTRAMVDRARKNITTGIDQLVYGYQIMLDILGVRFNGEYTVSYEWSQEMTEDRTETFSQLSQGHSAGVVSDVEYRAFFFPDETPEEAEKALQEIKDKNPDPFSDQYAGELFGREDPDADPQGGGGNE